MRAVVVCIALLFTVFFFVTFDRWSQQSLVNNFNFLVQRSSPIHASRKTHHLNQSSLTFPEKFKFGVSTSAHQIEGAWNEDGKTPSTWDVYSHEHSELITDRTNADIATDSYHLYKADIDAVNSVGVRIFLSDSETSIANSISVSALSLFDCMDADLAEWLICESEGD
jgi:hypothetical protein